MHIQTVDLSISQDLYTTIHLLERREGAFECLDLLYVALGQSKRIIQVLWYLEPLCQLFDCEGKRHSDVAWQDVGLIDDVIHEHEAELHIRTGETLVDEHQVAHVISVHHSLYGSHDSDNLVFL